MKAKLGEGKETTEGDKESKATSDAPKAKAS